MKSYFNSKFPFQPIDGTHYPQYHENKKTLIIPTSESTLRDVTRNYDSIVHENIPGRKYTLKYKFRIFFSILLFISIHLSMFLLCALVIVPILLVNNLSEGNMLEKYTDTVEKIVTFLCGDINDEEYVEESKDGQNQYDIEYFVVNLKESLRNNHTEFMICLQEACRKDISYLEIEVL